VKKIPASKEKKRIRIDYTNDSDYEDGDVHYYIRTPCTRSSERNKNKRRKKDSPEVIDIDDDSDEEEVRLHTPDCLCCMKSSYEILWYVIHHFLLAQITFPVCYDAVRIAIGSRVSRRECKITLTKGGLLVLSYFWISKKTHTITFVDEVQEAKYFLDTYDDIDTVTGSSGNRKYYDNNKAVLDEELEQGSLIALRVKKTHSNGLEALSNVYKPDDENSEKSFICVEFRSDNECRSFLNAVERLRDVSTFFCRESKLSAVDSEMYAKALIQDSEKEAQNRRRSPVSKKRDGFLAGRADNDILLCYPFGVDVSQLETAAHGLRELGGPKVASAARDPEIEPRSPNRNEHQSEPGTSTVSVAGAATEDPAADHLASESESSRRFRSHHLEIRVDDYKRLEPKEFLNDTLIDFFMQW